MMLPTPEHDVGVVIVLGVRIAVNIYLTAKREIGIMEPAWSAERSHDGLNNLETKTDATKCDSALVARAK